MSMDSVDDLEHAEDMIGSLGSTLKEILLAGEQEQELPVRRLVDAAELVKVWESYCRPTCRAEGEADSDECLDDCCGCPCHERGA